MLALGICGAVVQGCDDNDDNLDVLDKLQAAFSPRPGLLPMPFG